MAERVGVAAAELAGTTAISAFLGTPLCTLVVPNALLLRLYEEGRGYTPGVNGCISGNLLTLDPDCTRVETALRKSASRLHSRKRASKGSRGRDKLRDGETYVLVGEGETIEVKRLQDELQKKEEELQRMEDQERETRQRLEEEKREREEERREIESVTDAVSAGTNKGKKLEEVGERQKRRKISQVKTYMKHALTPLESYGLTPHTLTAVTNSGASVSLELGPGQSSTAPPSSTAADESTKTALFLLDRFDVSDVCYHELAQTFPAIPRLHHIKKLRSSLNEGIEILSLPPPYNGRYMRLRKIVSKTLSETLATLEEQPSTVTIKFSGDGAAIAASSTMVFLTFSFPGLADNVLSAVGNHTFASVKGPEEYDFLKACFSPVWEEVNDLISSPTVRVDEREIDLDIVFGSDYKFLALVMGLNKANATHACVWCTVPKDKRWDTSVPEPFYNTPPPSGTLRTLSSLTANCAFSKPEKHLGSKHPPLLHLEPSQYVLDELHLLLRVCDVLVRNVIHLADHLDQESGLRRGRRATKITELQKLIQSCGVPFRITHVQNENGRAVSGMYEWTSLTRAQNLAVLEHLPAKLNSIFPTETGTKIAALLMNFLALYRLICSDSPSPEAVHTKGKEWLEEFLRLGHEERLEGFQKKSVTPYIHCMVYHVPSQLRQHGNLLQFSGQGVEKNNDCAKHHFYSSNRHDPCGEVLRTEKRLEQLDSACRREKRSYRKQDINYWSERIVTERAEKRARRAASSSTPSPITHVKRLFASLVSCEEWPFWDDAS